MTKGYYKSLFSFCIAHKDAKTHILLFYTFLLNNNNNFIWKRDMGKKGIKENKKKPLHKAHNLTVFHAQNS